MRAIRKSAEPRSLTEYRATPEANYDDYKDKQSLRKSLVDEQRGLCCYCLCRIRAGIDGSPLNMKIEHWHCQSRYPGEDLVYANLLGACEGRDGRDPRIQHCDTKKSDADLKWNPANPLHPIPQLTYYSNGELRSEDPDFDRQIDEVLNLNNKLLVNNRKATLKSFVDSLPSIGTWPRAELEKRLRNWNGESNTGELEEYCEVVVYWLKKKLRQLR
jgi:uncharacterized protein (TIGR02646 family)